MIYLKYVDDSTPVYYVQSWGSFDTPVTALVADGSCLHYDEYSVLDFIDQEPGELDPWPTIIRGNYKFNPFIHYEISGELNLLNKQCHFDEYTIVNSGSLYPIYEQKIGEYAVVGYDFGDFSAFTSVQTVDGNGTRHPSGMRWLKIWSAGFVNGKCNKGDIFVAFNYDASDPVGSAIKCIKSFELDLRHAMYENTFIYARATDPKLFLDRVPRLLPPVDISLVDRIRVNALTYAPWSDMARMAYDSIELGSESNGIMYAVEYGEMKHQVQKLIDTFKINSATKLISSLYLSFIYGWKLTLQDTLDMRDALLEDDSLKRYRLCCSVTRRGDSTFRYTVYTDQYAKLRDLLSQLADRLDACLTLENVWDMVPYSFVVDWIIPIGDVLNSIDKFLYLERSYSDCFHCKTWNYVTKVETPAGYTGDLTLEMYERRYADGLISPSFSPTIENPFTHLIEGTALVLANTGRPSGPTVTW
nr:MAG: hypothetical protein 1 [Leviviridae sp.]